MVNPSLTEGPTRRTWILLLGFAVIIAAVSIPVNAAVYHLPFQLAFGGGLLQAVLVPMAVRAPRTSLALSLIPLIAFPLFSLDSVGLPWPVPVTTILVQLGLIAVLSFVSRWEIAAASWLLPVLAIIGVLGTTPQRFGTFNASLGSAIPFAAVGFSVLVICLLLAQRARIRAQLAQERQVAEAEQIRRELMEERNRIAREMHDVVAHGLSVIQIQASSAKYRLSDLDPAAAEEFDAIGATARTALSEMRQLLGVLRNEDMTKALGPQPGLEDIPALIESMVASGMNVLLNWDVAGSGTMSSSPAIDGKDTTSIVPASTGLACYRIVQESLSNAVRHAPGSSAQVNVGLSGAGVDVVIVNTASTAPPRPPALNRGTGHGLMGMRERVTLVNGTIETGPTPTGGFRVHAHLPVPAATEEP